MKNIEQKVIGFVECQKLISPGDKLLVAFSGGPDSVFLLYFLNKFLKKYKIEVTALHFNHNLRGKESNKDEEFAESFCEELNIPYYSIQLDVKKYSKENKISIEEAARKLRYLNLEEVCRDLECSKIATAHNLNDNTETVLMNFFTGTGSSGFTGIPAVRDNIIRPVLCLTKKEIVEYLGSLKIPFRVDSSNLKNDFKRNFLRNKIIPLLKEKFNPALDEAVFRSSKNLEQALSNAAQQIDFINKKNIIVKKDSLRIKIPFFESNSEWLSGEILKKYLRSKFKHDFEYDDFLKIKSLIYNQKGKSVQLSGSLIALREKDYLVFLNQKNEDYVELKLKVGETVKFKNKILGIDAVDRKDVKFRSGGKTEFITADKLDDIFILRVWKAGDSFVPLGMSHKKKISDFLTDSNIETAKRKNWFILENGNKIIWILGLRIDNRFKINSTTKKIYKLWMK